MAPNPRVAKAFRAMRGIGIPEEKVKPVLKNLLKVFEKNWEPIEEENYRALADAIFETEEAEAEEQKKKLANTEREKDLDEESQVAEEPERPLKRLRLRHQEVQASPSCGNSSPNLCGALSKKPKVEVDELPEAQLQSGGSALSKPSFENTRSESQPVSPQPLGRNKGKQPVSPKGLVIQERSDTSQLRAADRTEPDVTKRTESDSARRIRDKGKEPISPQAVTRENKSNYDMPSAALRLKEPKVEPGIVLLPRQKTNALIKPKDEPFTDDVPQFEVPLAVIRPEPKGDSSKENGPIREPDHSQPLALQSEGEKNGNDCIPASSNEARSGYELVNVPEESAGNLEIASSPSGEVKISLSCNSALGHMTSVDTLLKTVEDKCLRSYKVVDPNFSVKKLMKDMCECFLELGSDSTIEPQVVSPAIDLLQNCCAVDGAGTKGMPSVANGSVNTQADDDLSLPQPKLPSPCNGVDDSAQSFRESAGKECENEEEIAPNGFEDANSRSLVVVQQHQLTPDDIRSLHDVNDIAKGQEQVIISLVNEINSELPPSFHYIPQNAVFQNAYVNFSLARIGDDNCCSTCFGDCLSSVTPCSCALQTGGEFAYTSEGLVKEELLDECISMNRNPQKHCLFYCKECPLERSKNEEILEPCKGHLVRSFIKECWWKCGCNKQCGNRIVQRGIGRKLQVFMTSGGKGWGLRTLEDLPKGAFVCEYVGEVLTNAELYDRVSRSSNKDEHAYPVLLDADWGAESELKDEEALCLDATYYGNVARFINHRCFDSNLVEIPVEVETPDHHYYHLAFFTTRKVKALEELTWDYGIDFDDHDHPVKAFRCRCGSRFCRNIKRSSRSRPSRR